MNKQTNNQKMNNMEVNNLKNKLLQETIVLMAAELYGDIYNKEETQDYGEACREIIRLSEEFERQLDWRQDDERDYILELEKFIEEYRKKYID